MDKKQLIIIGLSHHTATLDQRSAFNWTAEQQIKIRHELQQKTWMCEHIILTTCNRTEIICLAEETPLRDWCNEQNIPSSILYVLTHKRATQHILRTLTGLDSLILGETEIIGQYKNALQTALSTKACHKKLFGFVNRCINLSKKMRQKTSIQHKPLAYYVVNKMTQVWPDLKNCKVLFIGAGTIIQQHLHYLQKFKLTQRKSLICRNPNAHQALAHRYQLNIFSESELATQLNLHDCIISATNSPQIIISSAMQKQLTQKSRIFFDLAVPRDIENKTNQNHIIHLDNLIPNGHQQNKLLQKMEMEVQHNTQVAQQFFELQNHSKHINQFRQNWINQANILQKKHSQSSFTNHQILEILRDKMHSIHRNLGIQSSPPDPSEKHGRCIECYAKTLLHTPTLHIKKLLSTTNHAITTEEINQLTNVAQNRKPITST